MPGCRAGQLYRPAQPLPEPSFLYRQDAAACKGRHRLIREAGGTTMAAPNFQEKPGFTNDDVTAICILCRNLKAKIAVPVAGCEPDELTDLCKLFRPYNVSVRHVSYKPWLDGTALPLVLPDRLVFQSIPSVLVPMDPSDLGGAG